MKTLPSSSPLQRLLVAVAQWRLGVALLVLQRLVVAWRRGSGADPPAPPGLGLNGKQLLWRRRLPQPSRQLLQR
jgi:hypothetical protein